MAEDPPSQPELPLPFRDSAASAAASLKRGLFNTFGLFEPRKSGKKVKRAA
jgi:hypothetical protein